jgi:hypothetical protein
MDVPEEDVHGAAAAGAGMTTTISVQVICHLGALQYLLTISAARRDIADIVAFVAVQRVSHIMRASLFDRKPPDDRHDPDAVPLVAAAPARPAPALDIVRDLWDAVRDAVRAIVGGPPSARNGR